MLQCAISVIKMQSQTYVFGRTSYVSVYLFVNMSFLFIEIHQLVVIFIYFAAYLIV